MPEANPHALVDFQLRLLESRLKQGLDPITIVATGPLTNIALLLSSAPGGSEGEFIRKTLSRIVIMGGAAGVPGNRSPLAEWNIMVDPEAAAIVLDAPIPTVMAGLNVTHQAIFTQKQKDRLAERGRTPIREMVASAMTFFSDTYREEFGFHEGPPVHDLLTVAYILDETLFEVGPDKTVKKPQRLNVVVDTRPGPTYGATIVDFYNQNQIDQQAGWGSGGRNVLVLQHLDVGTFVWFV